MELVLPMYNMHPYFSLKNLSKSTHYTRQNTVPFQESKTKTAGVSSTECRRTETAGGRIRLFNITGQ